MLRYETLPCESSPLFSDWREICDGIQRCWSEIDEENCDKLEFNECQDDGFRCTNGMCITEKFWFHGDRDCMDYSDEYFYNYGEHCPCTWNTIECDKHLCPTEMYSCNDGECVRWVTRMAFQRMAKPEKDCFSKRNLNYMCEVSPYRRAWTLENELCCPDGDYDDLQYLPWNIINLSNLTNETKYEYLFRCLFSNNSEHDFPCNHLSCTQFKFYPLRGLINQNFLIGYDYL